MPIFRTNARSRAAQRQREMQAFHDCLNLYASMGVTLVEDITKLIKAGAIAKEDAARLIARVVHANGQCATIMGDVTQ